MLDCLPAEHEWSAETQYLLLCTHLDAMSEHLEQLQALVAYPTQLLAQSAQLQELQARLLEADALFKALARRDAAHLQALESSI